MPSINVLDTGHIYRNPKPHVFSRHAYFPTVTQLPDGDLVAAMDIGEAFESPTMRSYACRSSDLGKTWSTPRRIFEPDTRDHAVSTTCRINHVGEGVLLGWACLFDRCRDQEGLANPETNGFCRTDFATVRSTDGGRTWSPPQPVRLPVDWHHFETCAPPLPVDDGRLLALTSPWPTWQGTHSPWGHNGMAFVSEDGGQSWTDLITVFDGWDRGLTGFEQAMTRLSDGRLLAVAWTLDTKKNQSVNVRAAFSDDGGRTFSKPIDTPLHGETCRPLALDDNHVLAVYRRVDKPGLWAQLARIEGETWTPLADQLLWGGQVVGRDEHDSAMASMSTLRFGCPAILRLANGEAYTAFWGVEDGVSSIRWFRIKADV